MRYKSFYPLTVGLVEDDKEFAFAVVKRINPHKDSFIGVCNLEGSFLCDSPGELFDSLNIGDRLKLVSFESDGKNVPLTVCRDNGDTLGMLPYADSVLPKMLIRRGLDVFCYLEAKEFNGGMIAFTVTVYCEKY